MDALVAVPLIRVFALVSEGVDVMGACLAAAVQYGGCVILSTKVSWRDDFSV